MDISLEVSSGSLSDRGLSEKRPQNEDAFLEIPKCGIYAVADGVGGAQAGEVASQMAVEILGEAFTNRASGADAEIVMKTAIERANTAIYQMASELPQLASMATTIVALHLDGNIATIGHVGDSRLYRVDRDGTLYRETHDHSMVAEEVRAGRMTEEQAETHPSRNIISRALGAEPHVLIDLKTMLIEPGTAFLICSDGITRHVGDQEIKGVLTFGGSPDEVCDYLKNLCYRRGADDNLTAVVVKVAAAEHAAANSAYAFHDGEEPTVATVRMQAASFSEDDEGELLELETLEMDTPGEVPVMPEAVEEHLSDQSTEETIETNFQTASEPLPEPPNDSGVETASPPAGISSQESTVNRVPTFGDSGSSETVEKSGSLAKMAAAAGLLLLGSAIGLGVYHFAIVPQTVADSGPQLSEMKSSNQPLSAFEENRRTVDRSPVNALAQFSRDPRDAEDFFLVGRSHLLLGHYPEASIAFDDALSRIGSGEVDLNNATTIKTEIAIAKTLIGDPTAQSKLRSGLDTMNAPMSTRVTNTEGSSNSANSNR